jgi:hypothetical protein
MISFNVTIKGERQVQRRISRWQAMIPKLARDGLRIQAHRLRTLIVKGIRNQAPGGQAFKPLADTTKEMKGSSKALIHRGDLIRSVGVDDVELGTAFFVGVNRAARGRDGKELANIAEIHEFGTKPYLIKVTPKLRRFWYAMFIKGIFQAPLKPSTTVIRHPGVPARPYLRPSYEEWVKDVNEQYGRYITVRLLSSGGS